MTRRVNSAAARPAPSALTTPSTPAGDAAAGVAAVGSPAPSGQDRGEWLRVVEALRLGVVPAAHVERYTVGRDAVMEAFRADLARSESQEFSGKPGASQAAAGVAGTGSGAGATGGGGTGSETRAEGRAGAGAAGDATGAGAGIGAGHGMGAGGPGFGVGSGMRIGGSLRIVFGDYGTGKSHLLEWMRQEALARGHLAARATLDDGDVSPAYPKRVYHALVSSLAYPGLGERALGLAPLLETLVARSRAPREREDPLHHRYLDAVLAYLGKLDPETDRELRRDLIDWAEGHPAGLSVDWNKTLRGWARGPYLLTLPDYRTFAHIYAYLLGGIAAWAREAGHKGLVVLLDEAEFYEVLGKSGQVFADGLLASLAIAALGPSGLLVDPETLPRGGQAVHRQISPVYAAGQPLHVVLFLTPVAGGTKALCRIVDLARHRLDLADLLPDDYRRLFDRVIEIYRAAHPEVDIPPDLARPMGDLLYASVGTGILANPRAALRLIVEFLDVARLARPRLLDWLSDVGRRLAAA